MNNILILDDLREEISSVAKLLSEIGYQVSRTNNHFEILDLIKKGDNLPNLILINADLKDKDSYLICKEIKILEKGGKMPLIFLVRDPRYFKPEIMFESGGDDYINYPFLPEEILSKIRTYLKIQDLETKLKEKSSQLQQLMIHHKKLQKILNNTRVDLEKFTTIDPVTKLANLRHFKEVLNQEWLRCSRQRISSSDLSSTNISLIICAINDFPQYQENYGEELAENCFKIVAEILKNTAKRPADLIGFYQEKFAVLLPNTDQNGAEKVAQKIEEEIKKSSIPHPYSDLSNYVTLSIGIATGIPTQALPSDILIDVAERALQEAMNLHQEYAIYIDSF
jgi:diguanylate cyclase (GGDEF)-like protein